MSRPRKHRKQWLISKSNKLNTNHLDGFSSLQLGERVFLHYDRDLALNSFDWPDGTRTLVLGWMIGTPSSAEKTVFNSGRFVAITSKWLSLDATGSMGVFYSTTPSEIICGSSCALLSEINQTPITGRDLASSARMNWDPSPLSRIANTKRLFVDQELNLEDGSTRVAARSVTKSMDCEQAAVLLSKAIEDTAVELVKSQRPLYLGLTGGSDSRAVFCGLIKAKADFEAFTLLLGDGRSDVDASIAQALCKRYNVRFRAVTPNGRNELDCVVFREHAAGCGGDRALKYVLGNYYDFLPDNAIVLHGGAFEIGQRFYESALKNVRFSRDDDALSDLERYFNFLGNMGDNERLALREWLDYRRRNPIEGVDMIDSFYIDQRRGAWGAANRQAEDCYGFDWLVYANSWSFVEPMLSVSLDSRRKNEVQKRAMEILVPGVLNAATINPPLSLLGNIKKYYTAISQRIKHF